MRPSKSNKALSISTEPMAEEVPTLGRARPDSARNVGIYRPVEGGRPMTFNRRNLIVRNSDRGRAVPGNRDSQLNSWTLPAIFILLITVNASVRSDPEIAAFLAFIWISRAKHAQIDKLRALSVKKLL